MTSGRLAYNGALDGIRALAVLAVIWYHAGALGGGWIGVEVFFVLSGYLITAILLRERDATGRIDLVDFWRRRARRLLPGIGLLVVLVAIGAAISSDLRPSRSIDNDLVGLLTYTSNWTTLGGDGYWQQFSAPSPLRHAWSLAVEEQFYLLYPLLAVVVLHSPHRRWWLAGLATVALAWQVTAPTFLGVERVYLGTDTRAFGLLAGATLAAFLAHRPLRSPAVAWPAVLVLAGLAFVLDDATAATFAGPFQLVVLASLGVVVDVVTRPQGSAHRVLAVEPLRLVGRWSYGIYLFHWPLLLLIAERFEPSPTRLALAVTVVAIPLAAASYTFIEGPIREGRLRRLDPPVRWLAPTGSIAVVLTIAAVVAGTAADEAPTAAAVADREITVNAPAVSTTPATTATTPPPTTSSSTTTPTTSPATTSVATTNPIASAPASSAIPTSEPAPTSTVPPPTVPPEPALVARPSDRPLRVYVVGDSLGASVGESLAASADDFGIDVFTRAAGGCGFDRERMQYFNGDFEPEACRDLVDAWRPDVLAYRPDAVIVAYAGWWGWFREGRVQTQCEPELADHVRALYDLALDDLGAGGAPVFFVSPANWEGDPVGPDGIPALFDCVRAVLGDWVDASSPAARLVDVAGMLCRGDRCDATIDGSPARPDRIHFGGPSAPAMMTAILREMIEPPPAGWIHAAEITPPPG